jgi:hypothetical protein
MRILIEMVGKSALVQHNVQLSDPGNPFTRAIAAITSKGSKQTDDERREVARLEFCGGLYIGQEGPFIGAAAIGRCIANAAKVQKLGKNVERALIPTVVEVPLDYKGPREPSALWADEKFHFAVPVRVGRGLILRMRPRFPEWRLVSEWELVETILDFRHFIAIAEQAGLIEGLGDARRLGFGRFTAKVSEAKANAVSRKAA